MALPTPFNTVEELSLWSGFSQGAATGQDSVLNGTFTFGMFQTALRESRREIYRKTGKRSNTDFDEDRLDELTEAEKWLAAARLYPNYGSRMIIFFPESNIQATGETMSGADTPSPYEKNDALLGRIYKKIRGIGLDLLEAKSNRFAFTVAKLPEPVTDFPCLESL